MRTRELGRHLDGLSDGSQGSVVLGASMSVGSYRLPHILTTFRGGYPDVDLRLSISDTEHAVEATRTGALDFSVVVSEPDVDIAGMEAEQIGSDEVVLVAAPAAGRQSRGLGRRSSPTSVHRGAPGPIRRTFVERRTPCRRHRRSQHRPRTRSPRRQRGRRRARRLRASAAPPRGAVRHHQVQRPLARPGDLGALGRSTCRRVDSASTTSTCWLIHWPQPRARTATSTPGRAARRCWRRAACAPWACSNFKPAHLGAPFRTEDRGGCPTSTRCSFSPRSARKLPRALPRSSTASPAQSWSPLGQGRGTAGRPGDRRDRSAGHGRKPGRRSCCAGTCSSA